MKFTRSAIAGILALFAVASASAQQFPTVPDHTVIGRIGVVGQSGPSQAIPFVNFLANVGGTQSANKVWAGPVSGAAVGPTFRLLVGADLPVPSASTLGGVQSLTCGANQWLNQISVAGAPVCAQPAVSNISGFGAGIAAALALGVGSVGAPVTNGSVLGIPSSGIATNITGLPLNTGVTGTLPVANGGTGDTGTAWSQTTPTPVPIGGAFTTATAVVRQKVEGKKVLIWASVTVTSVGTATSGFTVQVPTAALNTSPVGSINNNTGLAFPSYVGAGTTTLTFSIAPANNVYFANGSYEAQ